MTRKPTAARSAPPPASWHPHAWQMQSLLLGYPDERLPQHLALAHRVAPALPAAVAGPLLSFAAQAQHTAVDELAAAYVATFDQRKRCCPYVTYYAHGDTRRRGLALLRLKRTYATAGWRLADDELPDHLAVLLEFAATESVLGHGLLTEHRAGLELLRLSLRDEHAPWADLLDSVSATLPPLAGDEHKAVARLAAQGPPDEQVGLDPYAPAQFMPHPAGGTR